VCECDLSCFHVDFVPALTSNPGDATDPDLHAATRIQRRPSYHSDYKTGVCYVWYSPSLHCAPADPSVLPLHSETDQPLSHQTPLNQKSIIRTRPALLWTLSQTLSQTTLFNFQITKWWSAGVVICLERGADLRMAQLMPLPLTVSCFSKIQIGFTFLVPAHLGSPGQRTVKHVFIS